MTGFTRPRAAAALAAAGLLAACSPSDPIAGGCGGHFLPGDFAISEIFANPTGTDGEKEWFEIYNAGDGPAELAGVTLLTSKSDGTGEKKHRMAAVTLGAGDYLVVGTAVAGALPAYVNYGLGADLGELRNTAGRIAILCGSTLVDEVKYDSAPEGASLSFTGAFTPDAVANDDATMWCNGVADFGAGKGTPGAPNEPCRGGGGTGMCMDGATMRPVVKPAAGDLVITEWMADPAAADDTKGEWFELLVKRDVDLNGLQLGRTPPAVDDTVNDAACLRRAAGSRVLLARSKDAGMNGGLPAVDFDFGFGLAQAGPGLFVGIDGTVLDQVSYSRSTAGVAVQLDASKSSPADNDDVANLCAATATYGAGDKGTPGTPNGSCGTVVPGDQCNDGGTMRDIVVPKVGDLVITEYMADPSKAGDTVGEWFEVRVVNTVDLNGLQLGVELGTPRTTLTSGDCLKATADSLLVFGRSDMSMSNGGLPRVDYLFGFDLANTPPRSLVLARDGALIDSISYTKAPTAGVSSSLRPDKQNPTDNDVEANWCPTPAASTYGLGDRGTPGVANPPCP